MTHHVVWFLLNVVNRVIVLDIYNSNDVDEKAYFLYYLVNNLLEVHWLICRNFNNVETCDDKGVNPFQIPP